MPLKGSSQINPNALKNDYSGFERAAQIKAQTMAGLGKFINDGYKAHKQKIADKEEAKRALAITGIMMEQMGYEGDPEAAKAIMKDAGAGEINKMGGILKDITQIQKKEGEKIAQQQAAMMAVKNMPSLANLTPEARAALARANPGAITQILAGGAGQKQITDATLTVNEATNKATIERERLAEENRIKARGVEFERTKEITSIKHDNLKDLSVLDNKAAEERAAIGFEYGIELGNANATHQEKRDRLQSQLKREDLDYSSKKRIKDQLELEDALQLRKTKVLDGAQREALSLSRELRSLEDTGQGKSDRYTEVKTKLANLQKQTGIVISDTSPRTLQEVKENWDKLSVPSRVKEVVPEMKKDDWFVYQLAIEGGIPNSEKIIKRFHETYPQFTDQRGWIGRAWDWARNNESDPLSDATRSLHLDPGVKSEIDSYFKN
tara:strand:+ start:8128 stop:9441 length:1314 start_codon:yes stop_codon:yes gene_type:complete